MYKRVQGRIEIKWNPEHIDLAKQAISSVLNIPVDDIDENDYIEVNRQTANEINNLYGGLVEERYPEPSEPSKPTELEQLRNDLDNAIIELSMAMSLQGGSQ